MCCNFKSYKKAYSGKLLFINPVPQPLSLFELVTLDCLVSLSGIVYVEANRFLLKNVYI